MGIFFDWTEIDSAIRRDFSATGSPAIARRFGIARSSICRRAKRLGIVTTTQRLRQAATNAAAPTSVNQAFFESWSPNLAWLLGYIWADATISDRPSRRYVGFACVADDRQLLDDIQRAIGSHKPLVEIDPGILRGRYRCRRQVRFQITSKNVVRLLVDRYGIPPNKSNIDPPFPNIPDEWLSHFTRGVIDGDGYICRPAGRRRNYDHLVIGILGSHRFLESLRHRIATSAGVSLPTRHRRTDHGGDTKISVIKWSAWADVRGMIGWLYPSGDYLSLARKREAAAAYLAERSRPRPPNIPPYPTARRGRTAARVTFEKEVYSLGRHGSPESLLRYTRLVEGIQAGRRGEELRQVIPRRLKGSRSRRQ